ncbi:MAG: tRNA (adenosine(37)-N6)-threonylcarbamoyltransferase complex ATPase subunit type 1 TsaE [Mycoplasmataceae bacterium]|nr:tRNA (adenosine(37)-N6)-threonylcarbamoyltransferase complex ATPase subunit type 1 TsaE [Mycoplasmataceae bacterium]
MIYKIEQSQVPKLVSNLIPNLDKYNLLLLNGEMGVGKTFLVKEIAKQLGEKNTVTSPSFNIMNTYDKFIHIDAYNLKGGLESYYDFFEDKLVIIEWSNNINYDFKNCIKITIKYLDESTREYEIKEVI